MVRVDETRCTGCGVCLPACPTGALTIPTLRQAQGIAVIDPALCDGCQACIAHCPNAALVLVIEPEPVGQRQPSTVATVEPKIIPMPSHEPALWRRTILPAVGGALVWMGREIVPRLAPLTLDVLSGALDRRTRRRTPGQRSIIVSNGECSERGKQRRRQWRGRSRNKGER